MANINSLMSSTSSTNSLYGNRNVLSGLASGMDTEAMIENSVSGYKTKITQLEKEQTTYQWKQDAYRSITDKMYDLEQKYTSYTSKTNLYSPSFFNGSISTTPVGAAADSVSATGRSSSDIQIIAAKAATSTRYDVSAKSLGLQSGEATMNAQRLSGSMDIGTLKGSMTLDYDGQKIDISFDETDLIDNTANPAEGTKSLVDAIKEKLADQTVNTKYGTKKASDVISVGVNSNGFVTFSESSAGGQGATPYISSIDSSLKSKLGVSQSDLYSGSSVKKYTLSNVQADFTTPEDKADYLARQDINVTVDGVSKSFKLDKTLISAGNFTEAFRRGFESIGVGVDITGTGGNLTFKPTNTSSNLSISTKDAKAAELLGIGNGISNYLDEKTSIGTLLGSNFRFTPDNAAKETDTDTITRLSGMNSGDGVVVTDTTTGNRYLTKVNANSTKTFYRVDEKGESLYELKINDKSIYVTKDASLKSVLEGINNGDMGVKASYSKLTGKFSFTSTETGAGGNISFDNKLSRSLFGATSNVTLGDILGDEWFTTNPETGQDEVTLYTGTKVSTAKYAKGTFTKNTSVSEFLEAYNAKTPTAQFDDTGYNVMFGSTGETNVDNYYVTNVRGAGNGSEGMTLKAFAEKINQALANKASFSEGTNATVRAMVNGEAVTLQRASNTIEMDGMSVTLKGDIGDVSAYKTYLDSDTSAAAVEARKAADTANNANAVSFKTTGGSDDLLNTIRGFVDDYNALLKEIHDAYATQPAEKSSKTHARYEPLTEDDKKDMSDKAIENYEAKAKQGILFGDNDLRAAYESLVRNITASGADGAALRDMGIETTYSGGLTQIKLEESKLRDALDKNPDSVRNAFTKSKEGGASTDGLMTNIKKTLEQYGSSSYTTPGILVKKAGSTHNATSLLNNDMQKQLDNVQNKIEQWQTKMGVKIDYYTRQFTALEKLMNTMNSQSSALAGLMGM